MLGWRWFDWTQHSLLILLVCILWSEDKQDFTLEIIGLKLERHMKTSVHLVANCWMVLIGQKAGDWGKDWLEGLV